MIISRIILWYYTGAGGPFDLGALAGVGAFLAPLDPPIFAGATSGTATGWGASTGGAVVGERVAGET